MSHRLLIHTDTPCLYSGLARCGRELAKRFFEATEKIEDKDINKFQIAYAGWHHQIKPYNYPYFIYPIKKSGKYEDQEFKEILDDFDPDIILSIGDIWNFSKIFNVIQAQKEKKKTLKWLLWLTVDGENWHSSWKNILNLADEVCVFSEFGQKVVKDLVGYECKVIYPGVDKDTFKKIDVNFRTKDQNLPFNLINTFIVLNINQNTDRKNFPLTIEAFRDFAKDKDDVFLLLVTNPEDPYGFDLWDLISKFKLKKKVAITKETGPLKGMSDEKLNLIYNIASVLVNTSIGEGFSLPTLEAMAVGLPVITTNYAATAELVDKGSGNKIDIAAYIYGYSGVKRAIASKDDLVRKLENLYQDYKTNKSVRNEISSKSIDFASSITWDKTAESLIESFDSLLEKKEEKDISFVKTNVKISECKPLIIIPSWGKNCGIAEYTKSLLEEIKNLKQSSSVFASYSYSEISNLIKTNNYNLMHIEHEFSFFRNFAEFKQLLRNAKELKAKIVLTLHSLVPGLKDENETILDYSDNVIVHCNAFKEILEENFKNRKEEFSPKIEVIEMGCGNLYDIDQNRINETKKNINISNRYPIIGSFGFLREQKGYHDLLLAVKELKNTYKDILLLIVAPKHEFGSSMYDNMFFNFITKHKLENNVLIIREYLKEEKLLTVLQCVDLFVLNYIDSPIGGGISAAIKTLFRVQKPILVREGIAFTDLVNAEVLKIRDIEISALVKAIDTMIKDKELCSSLVKNANDFVIRNNWKNVAQKHIELYYR